MRRSQETNRGPSDVRLLEGGGIPVSSVSSRTGNEILDTTSASLSSNPAREVAGHGDRRGDVVSNEGPRVQEHSAPDIESGDENGGQIQSKTADATNDRFPMGLRERARGHLGPPATNDIETPVEWNELRQYTRRAFFRSFDLSNLTLLEIFVLFQLFKLSALVIWISVWAMLKWWSSGQ